MRRFLILLTLASMAFTFAVPMAGTASAAGKACPEASPGFPGDPRCGKPKEAPTPKTCGPETSGGTAPGGPVTDVVYEVGHQFTANGGAPVGDFIQTVACAVHGIVPI